MGLSPALTARLRLLISSTQAFVRGISPPQLLDGGYGRSEANEDPQPQKGHPLGETDR